ncbi:hypothetical protein [Ferrovibrio sp.]|uniref:hypothetical protein n=1 Tax=Ferrovibrio sp. TaxID=1917215 RepID=UPI00311F9005
MSYLFTAKQICEQALRKIGAYSVNDSAADPVELAIAMNWLDLIMAEFSGTTQVFWLVNNAVNLTLTTAVGSYTLPAALGADAPANGIQFINSATLVDENGDRTPLTIFDYQTYNQVTNKQDAGDPTGVYIERLNSPVLYTYPTATFDTGLGESRIIELNIQSFANSVAADRATTRIQSEGSLQHGLRASWQRWAINRLARDLGDGPIRNLPSGRLDRLNDQAMLSEKKLLAFENRETFDAPIQTAYRDY